MYVMYGMYVVYVMHVYIYIYVCMYVCRCVCVYIYTHNIEPLSGQTCASSLEVGLSLLKPPPNVPSVERHALQR